MRRLAGAVIAGAAVALSACGGPMRPEELQRGVETIGSTAAQGVYLADGVARDRTRSTFTRVQARELAEVVDHEAEKLADASAPSELAGPKSQAVALAQAVGEALGELQVHPGDERVGTAARERLRRLAEQANRLGAGL